MLESQRLANNEAKLAELYPAMRVRVEAVLKELEEAGYRPRIYQAWRSADQQMEAFRQGVSQVMYGFHNVTASNGKKEALAVDILDDDHPLTAPRHYMLRLAAASEKNGLITGIRWGLPDSYVKKIDDALATQNWSATFNAGWDPVHVEVTGITIYEAKGGKRPAMPGEETLPTGGTTGGTTGSAPPPAGEPETGGQVGAAPKRRYKVQNVDTDEVQDYELAGALKPVSLLAVPYVSQLTEDADAKSNDCGAACAVMLMKAYQKISLTPNEFYTQFGITGDPYLSVTQLQNAMRTVGLLTSFKAGQSIQDIFNLLASSKPSIALIKYKTLVEAGLTEKTFAGPHFFVIVGMDFKYIYVHDPLYSDPSVGEAHPYPLDVFWKAWKDVATDPTLPNPERSLIIPNLGIGFQVLRQVKVNVSSLNVRSGPGLNHGIVDTVKLGMILDVTREMSGWGEIGFNRWVSLSLTTPVKN